MTLGPAKSRDPMVAPLASLWLYQRLLTFLVRDSPSTALGLLIAPWRPNLPMSYGLPPIPVYSPAHSLLCWSDTWSCPLQTAPAWVHLFFSSSATRSGTPSTCCTLQSRVSIHLYLHPAQGTPKAGCSQHRPFTQTYNLFQVRWKIERSTSKVQNNISSSRPPLYLQIETSPQ